MRKFEVWLAIDSDGQYVIDKTQDDVAERVADLGLAMQVRFIKVLVKADLPSPKETSVVAMPEQGALIASAEVRK